MYLSHQVYWYAHQINTPCKGSRNQRSQAGNLLNLADVTMYTLAGKIAISRTISTHADRDCVSGKSKPNPKAISAMPLKLTINR